MSSQTQQSPKTRTKEKATNMDDLARLCYAQTQGGNLISEIASAIHVEPNVIEQIFSGEIFSLATED